jgi:hypothetical protein
VLREGFSRRAEIAVKDVYVCSCKQDYIDVKYISLSYSFSILSSSLTSRWWDGAVAKSVVFLGENFNRHHLIRARPRRRRSDARRSVSRSDCSITKVVLYVLNRLTMVSLRSVIIMQEAGRYLSFPPAPSRADKSLVSSLSDKHRDSTSMDTTLSYQDTCLKPVP